MSNGPLRISCPSQVALNIPILQYAQTGQANYSDFAWDASSIFSFPSCCVAKALMRVACQMSITITPETMPSYSPACMAAPIATACIPNAFVSLNCAVQQQQCGVTDSARHAGVPVKAGKPLCQCGCSSQHNACKDKGHHHRNTRAAATTPCCCQPCARQHTKQKASGASQVQLEGLTSSGSTTAPLASRPVMFRTKRLNAGMRVAPPTINTCVIGARRLGRTCMTQLCLTAT